MFHRAILASCLACACATPHAQRLPDGSFTTECNTQKVCLDRAERECGSDGYRIIEGEHGQKVVGVPGNQKPVGMDKLHFSCKRDTLNGAPEPSNSASAPPTAASTNDSSLAKPTPPNAAVCRPGETQKCVGAGACVGGQACNSTGTAFGPCDCG